MKNNKEQKIKVLVKKIISKSRKSNFVVLDVDVISYDKESKPPASYCTAIGNVIDVRREDIFTLTGKWVKHTEHGYQFKISHAFIEIPESILGLRKFLVRKVSGIGTTTAKKLLDKFGENIINVVENEPEKLSEVVSEKISKKLIDRLSTLRLYQDLKIIFKWLSENEINSLIDNFGVNAKSLIRDNPYIAAKAIKFEYCEETAKNLGFKNNDNKRIKALIMQVLRLEINKSHVYTEKMETYNKTYELIKNSKYFKSFEFKYSDFEKQIEELEEKERIEIDKYTEYVEPTNKDCKEQINLFKEEKKNKKIEIIKENIYTKELYVIENNIVSMLNVMLKEKNEKIKEEIIEKEIVKSGLVAGEEQKNAVKMAINNKISILSGGPGTGKTHTINILTTVIRSIDPTAKIVLSAPTGIAAKRMTQFTGLESSTIHRLLEIYKEEDSKPKPIDADYVIIDEMSMMDVSLVNHLLNGIQKDTKLLLVGDYNQLPSVGPGLVARDFINSNRIETTILKKVYRQALDSQIVKNANNIVEEKEKLYEDNSKEDFYFIENRTDEAIREKIKRLIERLLSLGYSLDDVQLISTKNKGALSVEEFNNFIQEKYNKREEWEKIKVGKREIRLGDRVIHTENNKDLKVFNGEVGTVIKIKNQEILVDFGDKEVLYTKEFFNELQLAYCLTVHKSQGSEFRVVIMPVSETHDFMLRKSLLYTALTRAKEKMILVGSKDQYFKAIKDNTDLLRRSKIKEKLMEK